MELFYTISARLATGKKKMWGESQKIHRGSLAFFGKWDKIRGMRVGAGRGFLQEVRCGDPSVTTEP